MTAHGNGILVAGMHRSGTSAMSGALQRLGVALGPSLIPGADDNPKGYFEHAGVVAIHEALFRELGSWWYDPRPLPAGWLETPGARRAEDALAKLLRHDFGDAALWAVKDPRTCRFLPLWRRVLERLAMPAAALLVLRAPAEVAASLTARNGFGPELGELLWLRHVLDSVRDTDGLARTVILYEDLIAHPQAAIDDALGRLGLASPAAAPGDALAGFIEPRFQHHGAGGDTAASPLSMLARRVFASLRELAHGGGDWAAMQAHQADFEQLWNGIGPAMKAMADAVFPELEAKAKLSEEIYSVRAELNAQLRWAEQVVGQHRALSEQRDAVQATLTHERDELQAALAHARSDLNGQVRWAEQTLEQHRLVLDELHTQLALDREQLRHLQARETELLANERQLLARERELSVQLAAMQASFSWRATKPLRAVDGLLRGTRKRPPADAAGGNESEGNTP